MLRNSKWLAASLNACTFPSGCLSSAPCISAHLHGFSNHPWWGRTGCDGSHVCQMSKQGKSIKSEEKRRVEIILKVGEGYC